MTSPYLIDCAVQRFPRAYQTARRRTWLRRWLRLLWRREVLPVLWLLRVPALALLVVLIVVCAR